MLLTALVMSLGLNATTPVKNPYACDLAPSFGSENSNEGAVDVSVLSVSCRYNLISIGALSISPVFGLSKQLNSTKYSDDFNQNITTDTTQNIYAGLRIERRAFSNISIFYSGIAGLGKGSRDFTESTKSSSLSGRYSSLKHSFHQHSLGASALLTKRLSLSVAYQFQASKLKWASSGGSFVRQNVDSENRLSIDEGDTSLLSFSPKRFESKTNVSLVQFGLSFAFGGK